MPDDNSRFIVRAAKERHRTSMERVLEVLRRFDRDGTPITFVAVAAAASVSRPWLYREPTLRAEILRSRTAAPAHPLVPAAQRASAESQRRKIEALNEELRAVPRGQRPPALPTRTIPRRTTPSRGNKTIAGNDHARQ